MMSKRLILSALCAVLMVIFSVAASADDTLITIVVPEYTTEKPAEKPAAAVVPKLYPVSVTETAKNGRREVVKTYELSPYEKPSDIPRDSFERDGYIYTIADVTKKENVKTEQKEQSETVAIDSPTKDFDEILKLLDKSKEYKNGGFTGVLELDVSSITVEQAGTARKYFTLSETREYCNLSSNDTSLIPKTIADKYGRTLTLNSISWKSQTANVDYENVPDSYTAVVKYTGTGYSNVVGGYSITAVYRGIVGKTVTGKTVYQAVFIGAKIIPQTTETTTEQVTETQKVPDETVASTTEETTAAEIDTTQITETQTETETEIASKTDETTTEYAETKPAGNMPHIIFISIIILETAALIGSFFYYKKKIPGGNGIK